MKFITAYTILCEKSKGKDHNHWMAFSIYSSNKKYHVYFEECMNGRYTNSGKIAVFYSEKLARSFCRVLCDNINKNLEKFDVEKLRLK